MNKTKLVLLGSLATLGLVVSLTLPVGAKENDKKENRFEKPAGQAQQVQIFNDGKIQVDGAKITAINSPVITATSTWGSATITWNIKTSSGTSFIRRYDGKSSLSEMGVGDLISVKGTLDTTTSPLTINAKSVKDWSVQSQNARFSGTVQNINVANSRFDLVTSLGTITVQTSATTKITRGKATINFNEIVLGEKATASGLYNNLTHTLQAKTVELKKPEAQTWQGTIKSMAGTTKPTSLVITSGGTDYTLQIASDTAILNNWWGGSNLTNFSVGQTVRVYGTLRLGTTTIDATVVRNTSIN